MASRRMDGGHCEPAWCPIEVSIEVIGGTWKVIIVRELLSGTKRYSELHRASSVSHTRCWPSSCASWSVTA